MRAVSAVMLFVALCGIRPWGTESSSIAMDCKMDAVFMIDNSDSITSSKKYMENWNKVIAFAQHIARSLDIAPTKTHVALVDFHTSATIHFGLTSYTNEDDAVNAIGRLAYVGESTNTPQGLYYSRDVLMTTRFGARKEVPKVIFVITDGEPAEKFAAKLDPAIYNVKQKGIRIIAVGVTEGVKVETLKKLASSENGYFVAKDFKDLEAIKDLILNDETCVKPTIPPPSTAPPTTPTTTTLPTTTLPTTTVSTTAEPITTASEPPAIVTTEPPTASTASPGGDWICLDSIAPATSIMVPPSTGEWICLG